MCLTIAGLIHVVMLVSAAPVDNARRICIDHGYGERLVVDSPLRGCDLKGARRIGIAHRDRRQDVAEFDRLYTEQDLIACAKMLWGEARGCSDLTKARCVWTVCNRVDAGIAETPYKAITAPNQYHGYSDTFPVTEELLEASRRVLDLWSMEKQGYDIERDLPAGYCWFYGDGVDNYFRDYWQKEEG